jgi:uncharacterized membrane protein YjjP (DUF1212 family)
MIKMKKPYQALIFGLFSGLVQFFINGTSDSIIGGFIGGFIGALLVLYIFYDEKNNYIKYD